MPGPNPNAWHNWYHVVGSTRGTWLPGDPRGFRTFRHREHVEGDYRAPPPPGTYEQRHAATKAKLKGPPVVLGPRQRSLVCDAIIEKLGRDAAEALALAISSCHMHLLARFRPLTDDELTRHRHAILRDGRDPAPRHFSGRARRNAAYALRAAGLKPVGSLWAARVACKPVRDRGHQVNLTRYIARHVEEGAAVWVMGRGRIDQLDVS